MLQAHSFLWHYGWVAPNVLSLALAVCVWRRGLNKSYPWFFGYLVFASLEGISLYVLDLAPAVGPRVWWYAFWAGAIIEGLWKFLVIAELLQHLLQSWPSVAKVGRNVVSVVGALLVLTAAVAAAFAAPDNTPQYIAGAHVLSQTLYFTEAGLIVAIFVMVAYLKIPWDQVSFGIALSFAIVWCEHLAIFALISGGIVRNRDWVDLANMATYHLGVLVWFYYLIVPHKAAAKSTVLLPESNLDVWNRELERLLQQ